MIASLIEMLAFLLKQPLKLKTKLKELEIMY